ncbi:hypothetical protein [Spirillospora sp. CA-294931]|uniref:hypothetical protein n=1 Tax=Spirillospora sp. CA-294931 TaxID=3240042 RepID=UPI003D8CCE5E
MLTKTIIITAATGTLAISPVPALAQPAHPLIERGDTLVVYERIGGYAGLHDKITIDRDGRAVVSAAKTTDFMLTTGEYRDLRRALDQITSTWSSSSGCEIADHFTYSIQYRGWQASRCHEPPQDWTAAVKQLDSLIDGSAW